MSESISLYRRHRPGSFDEVVGQEHVVRTLRNAIGQDKVHHAYLFVGSRGTGKTSMAKILARSLNCEQGGPTATPCGVCESCVTIASGTSVDVIEMDAASNRSVDDIRELRERVAYAPSAGRWKVYILDEAHMLTKEAWNAFLKTLEEPPPNTVFVLATTEAHRVMPTIVDRCQRFDFHRPSLDQIAEVLRRVSVAEGIEIEPSAVAMISRAAAGSFRDALGTLDQLVAFGGNSVRLSSVLEVLGAADGDLLFETVDAVASENPKGALDVVERMAKSGRDPAQFARDLLAHLRHLIVVQVTGVTPDSFVVSTNDADRLASQAAEIGSASLLRAIDEIAAAITSVRDGDEARMAIEVALLKAARPDLDGSVEGLIRRIERLERRLTEGGEPIPPHTPAGTRPESWAEEVTGPGRASVGGQEPAAEPTTVVEKPPAVDQGTAVADRGPVSAVEAPGAAVEGQTAAVEPESAHDPSTEPGHAAIDPDSIDLEAMMRVWPAVLDGLRKNGGGMLAALFEGARPVRIGEDGGSIEIGFPSTATFNQRKVSESEQRERLQSALYEVIGQPMRPIFVVLETEGSHSTEHGPVDEDEILERLKTEFNAEEVN